ncbi:MAG: hypothetical protein V4671_04890 [Armatimonadota bacterium]
MSVTISEFARRPKRAAEADGLNDIIGGVGILAATFMWYANQQFTATIQGSHFEQTREFKFGLLLFIAAAGMMFSAILLAKRYAKSLREQFVYPRVGYVAQPAERSVRGKVIRVAGTIAAMSLIAVLGSSMINAGRPPRLLDSGSLMLLLGAFTSVSYFYHFSKLGFIRHAALGMVSLIAALILASVPQDSLTLLRIYSLTLGLSSIVAGAFTFTQLLRMPVFAEDENE